MSEEMMAIGDSLYNGVRSLTIDGTLASNAVPAQVARAFGWDFVVPDYPRVVLADFEALFSDPRVGNLDLSRSAAANAHAWLADKTWSQHAMFDNLSIAQQRVEDLSAANYAGSLAVAEALAAMGAALPIEKIPTLYQAINTCFILNPTRTANSKQTALDIISAAKPKRLLINIGINNGLWSLLLLANAKNFAANIDPTQQMASLAGALEAKCGSVENFYINLFPKPSAIANLMARTDDESPSGGYYQRYLGRLLQAGGIDGDTMREVDTWVQTNLNPRIRQAFAVLGSRANFVDLYDVTANYDTKNQSGGGRVIVKSGRSEILIDNFPLEVLPFGGRREGGLFGLDNLHPTIVGYGLIAQAVCDTIAHKERLAPRTIDLQACYDADTLLHNLPANIALADFVLSFIGGFIPGLDLTV
jgi:hypothetical protein